MELHAKKFALACIATFFIIGFIASLLLMMMSQMMNGIPGHMFDEHYASMGWRMSTYGFLIGIFIWSVAAGVIGWLFATIYNKLVE
ncbi:MAG: putative membrane protein [Psychromonas sp.]|jgi:uncharacterized membrane protein